MPAYVDPAQLYVIESSLLKSLRDRFAALPPGYKGFIAPEDIARWEALELAKQGTADDLTFLQVQLQGVSLPRFEAEQAGLRSRVSSLEAKLKDAPSFDVILYKTGGRLEGTIVEQTEAHIKVRKGAAVATIPMAEVKELKKGAGAGSDVPRRLQEAGTDIPKLVVLLDWCKSKNLVSERDLIACRILTLDASHERSREELGIARPTGSVPGAGSAPLPVNPVVAASTESTARQIDLAAADVVRLHASFVDVVEQMKERTLGLKLPKPAPPPGGIPRALQSLPSAAHFRPADLSVQEAREVGAWWSTLKPGERTAFARWFGHACAHARTVSGN